MPQEPTRLAAYSKHVPIHDDLGETMQPDPGELLAEALSGDQAARDRLRAEWSRSQTQAHALKRFGGRCCVIAGLLCPLLTPQPPHMRFLTPLAGQAVLTLWSIGLLIWVAALAFRLWLLRSARIRHLDVNARIAGIPPVSISKLQPRGGEKVQQSEAELLLSQEIDMERVAIGCGAVGLGWIVLNQLSPALVRTTWFPKYIAAWMVLLIHILAAWWWVRCWLGRKLGGLDGRAEISE